MIGFQLAQVRVTNFRPHAVNDFQASNARTQTGSRTSHPLYWTRPAAAAGSGHVAHTSHNTGQRRFPLTRQGRFRSLAC